MEKMRMTETILQAKWQKKTTWEALGSQVGLSPVFLASVCHGQNATSPAIASQLCAALDIVDPEVASALCRPGSKHWDWQVPQDPLIYRLYEFIGVYGESLRDVIQEKFGDGIMSAIDFNVHVDKVHDEKGDRVQLTLNGKFLPYKSW